MEITRYFKILRFIGLCWVRRGYRPTSLDIETRFEIPISTATSYLNRMWHWGYLHRGKSKEEKIYRYRLTPYGFKRVKKIFEQEEL